MLKRKEINTPATESKYTIFHALFDALKKKETEKVRNPMIKYLLLAIVVMIAGIILFYKTFLGSFGIERKKENKKVIAERPIIEEH